MSQELPTQLRILTGIETVSPASWEALLDDASQPFLQWNWLWALEGSGSASSTRGWKPRHLTLWRGSKLIAASPAYVRDDSYGEYVYDWGWAAAAERAGLRYYPKLVLAVPVTPATGTRFLVAAGENRSHCEREIIRGAIEFARSENLSSIHVLFPTAEEAFRLEEYGFAHRLSVQYHWRNNGYHSYEEFLARFRSKRRNQLQREKRAAAEQGIEIRTLRGDDLSPTDAATVYALYCSTVDKHIWGKRLLNLKFFEGVLARFSPPVEVVEARKDGRLVGGAFNVRGPRILYGRYWGCFEDFPFLHFNVCFYHSIEQCIREGIERFEPGAGGEHKLVRGFEPTVTHSGHLFFHPHLDRGLRQFIQQERLAIEQGLPQWRLEVGFRD